MSEPIAKCRCGRLFSPMQWAELSGSGPLRICPCGLTAAKIQPITLADVKVAYEKSLKEGEPQD